MPKTVFKRVRDRALSTLSVTQLVGDPNLTLATGGGALFPTFAGNPYWITVEGEQELVTGLAGDVLTTTRAQNGTVASAHAAGVAVEIRIVAAQTTDIQTTVNALEDGQGDSVQTKVLTVVGDTIPITSRIVKLNNTSGGSLTLTSAPTLANGVDGQRLTLINISAQNVVIQDQGTLPASNARLTAAGVTITPRDSVELTYDVDVGDWVQTGNLVAVL